MSKIYRIYLTENGLEQIATVNSIECVLGIIKELGADHFMVIERDNKYNCDDIITYKIQEMLKENCDNVSRGTQKVYKRKKQ